MCGIAGVVELDGSREPAAERLATLERMIDLIGHRGPDESGTFVDERVALAAVRLKILDLERGQQPMGDPSGRFWIVYNGEIYNYRDLRSELEALGHRFESTSDTEVALAAWTRWGPQAPSRFDGGFAFAIYDRRERAVSLVRDRFGKRPLFYRADGPSLVFGSEIKVLLARRDLVLRWDPARLAAALAAWTPFDDETPYEGVRQVPPGGIVRLTRGGLEERRYAAFPAGAPPLALDLDEAADRTRSLLVESVRRRLVADVEVGVLVSGGLDSSVLAHLVREEIPGVRAFSIGFDDPRFDETTFQDRLVRHLGLRTDSIRISTGDVAAHFRAALWHAEVPQFRTAFVPMYLLARGIAGHGIKVVLSGEGADESFLGYDLFKETRLRAAWSVLDPEVRRARLRNLYPWLPHFTEANARALETVFARSAGDPAGALFSHALRFDNGGFAARLVAGGADPLARLRAAVEGDPAVGSLSPVRKAQWLEFHTLLAGYLLSSQGDRMTFAHGVESRCPFLGPAVVEFAARLPEDLHLSPDDVEKRLLKHAFRDALPREILERPKQPYRAPDAASFVAPGGGLAGWVEDALAERELREVAPLDAAAATRLVEKVRRTPPDRISPREDQAFVSLLSLVLLDRTFVRRLDLPSPARRAPLVRAIDLTAREEEPHA